FWRPGAVLAGDAACFVDPVFSTGVHLATYSALLAARSINTCLRGELPEDLCFTEYEARYRLEFGLIYDYLVAFYDQQITEEGYFWAAKNILGTAADSKQAFVRLISGGGSTEGRMAEFIVKGQREGQHWVELCRDFSEAKARSEHGGDVKLLARAAEL